MAKLRINLTETVNDLLDVLKQIGQMKFDWFATAQVARRNAPYACLAFTLAQADGGARPPQLDLCLCLATRAKLIDSIGHELSACAAFEGCCGLLKEGDYGFGEIQATNS